MLVLAPALLALPAFAQTPEDLSRIEAAIADSRDRVAHYEREERGLLDALEAIERSTALLRTDAERARTAAARARRELAQAERGAREAERRLAELERAMKARAIALYRAGELGTLRLLFSAGGLEDFFRRVQMLRRLLRRDGDLLAQHRAQRRALEDARERAIASHAAAAAAQQILDRRTRELAEERGRKRTLARRLRRSRARERGALAELELAARALEETVAAWQGRPPPSAATPPAGPAFEAMRGRLPSPVDGELRGRFGRVVDRDSRTATFRKGVAWEAAIGTPVRAVASGRVRYAGRFRGYGQVVILDHGDDYFSVSAHLDRIDVALGDAVSAGDAIGALGESGSLDGPRLYFEIRRGGEALDPATWLAGLGTGAARR